ncbi:MAG: hypothetical protein R2849_21310, partial [Thermomicrobiales bacterium]
ATMFLLMNPAVVALIWLGYRKERPDRTESRTLGVVAVIAAAILSVMVLIGESLLDALDLSDETFLIAAGVLVIFAAFQAFLRIGQGYALEERTWLVVAVVLWLTSPAALAVAVAIRLEDGTGTAIVAGVLAVVVALSLGYLWVLLFGDRQSLVLGWIRRVLAALTVIGGVDLIRQGVLSI